MCAIKTRKMTNFLSLDLQKDKTKTRRCAGRQPWPACETLNENQALG